MRERFARFARRAAEAAGSPQAFSSAIALIVLWALSGPFMRFSDTWQLLANTGTTLITFLLVFLIQHTQNHDTAAIQRKIDELIRVTRARNRFIHLEDAPDPNAVVEDSDAAPAD